MRIEKTYVDFTDIVDVGRFGFFIVVDDDGVQIDNDELGKQAIHFPRVVFKGKEPFSQRDDILKVVKYIRKHNPMSIIEFNTKGLQRPIGIGTIPNIIYNVHIQLKHTGLRFDERVKPGNISWFNEMDSNFVFSVRNEDDIDEANLFITEYGILKQQVFLSPKEDTENLFETMAIIIKQAKYFGFNFTAAVEHDILKEVS